MIRAKMQCMSVEKFAANGESVKFAAVHGGASEANKTWSKWTPSGSLTLHVSNPEVEGKFIPGSYYFLDFTETDKDG